MAYLLDSNVFIQAKNLHYGFDFCPAFWDWILLQNDAGRVFSIERVELELQERDDELTEWAAARGPAFFLRPDAPVNAHFATVAEWVMGQGYQRSAQEVFLGGADFFLVAHALAHGHTVVTHEKPDASRKRVKIPNVCVGLQVPCRTTVEMLRTERARFVLSR